MSNDRHFLVRRLPQRVVIREVAPGSCASTFTREQAWAQAQLLAKAAKSSQSPKRKVTVGIVFTGLDGSDHVVATAKAVQERQNAELAAKRQQGAVPAPAPRPARGATHSRTSRQRPATTPQRARTAVDPALGW